MKKHESLGKRIVYRGTVEIENNCWKQTAATFDKVPKLKSAFIWNKVQQKQVRIGTFGGI